jgi:hypothetical protein
MHWLPRQGKLYMETGAGARAAFDANRTAVLAYNPVRDRKAQTSAFLGAFGGKKRIVDSFQVFGWDSLPAVSYFDACEPIFVPGPDG